MLVLLPPFQPRQRRYERRIQGYFFTFFLFPWLPSLPASFDLERTFGKNLHVCTEIGALDLEFQSPGKIFVFVWLEPIAFALLVDVGKDMLHIATTRGGCSPRSIYHMHARQGENNASPFVIVRKEVFYVYNVAEAIQAIQCQCTRSRPWVYDTHMCVSSLPFFQPHPTNHQRPTKAYLSLLHLINAQSIHTFLCPNPPVSLQNKERGGRRDGEFFFLRAFLLLADFAAFLLSFHLSSGQSKKVSCPNHTHILTTSPPR